MTKPLVNARFEAEQWRRLKDDLLAKYPNMAEDDKALFDTLDGSTNLVDALRALMYSADQDEILLAGIAARANELKERAERINLRFAGKRDTILRAMVDAGIPKLEWPEYTVSVRKNPPKPVVVNEELIPADLWRERIVRSVDKTALKDALMLGPVTGAAMDNGSQSLMVRKT